MGNKAKQKMRVLMVDDHVMVLQGLKSLLGVLAPNLTIDTADSMAAALRSVAQHTYELLLLDWSLDDSVGEASFAALRDAGCTARIVVLSGEHDAERIRHAMELGAAGFVPKRYSSETMVAALEHVLQGEIFLPPEAFAPAERTAAAVVMSKLAELTPRQVEVYRAAARGLPNKLIASELGIAESTIKTHLKAVYAVLGVRNRTEAAYQASREGVRIARD